VATTSGSIEEDVLAAYLRVVAGGTRTKEYFD